MTTSGATTIPPELTSRAQWVLWREEPDKDGKPTKIPYQVDGTKASSTDPYTWTRFHVVNEVPRDRNGGIGFVLTSADDIVGGDLDKCIDQSGVVEPWALDIISRVDTYTEISPSGHGIRFFARGILPPSGRKRGKVELYESGRYLTVTGNHLSGTPTTINERTAELAQIHAQIFGVKSQPAPTAVPSPTPVDMSDAELIEKALAAQNGASFSQLWAGDCSLYPSQSEADQALANDLAFWTAGDADRIDQLFRQSGLMREKWDQRHFSSGETYGQRTIANALAATKAHYQPWASTVQAPVTSPTPNGQQPTAPKRFPRTDLGLAERLVERHGASFRYCHTIGWLYWDGMRWCRDDMGTLVRYSEEMVRSIYAEASTESDADERKAIIKFGFQSESERAINAAISLARADIRVVMRQEDFDKSPWLLNTRSGVLDLRSGTLCPQSRDDLITRLAPVKYDTAMSCPIWRAFLDRVFAGDQELICFVQRAVGYSLTGLTSERVIFILWGAGRNGKSTLLETILLLLGDYGTRTPTETLTAKREGAIPNDLARLRGTRFVSASESERGKRLDEALVKMMTGGDTLTARFLRQEWFDFRPEFKLWLATNHKPIVRGTNHAIWDRIRLIPFSVRIPEIEQDRELLDKLRVELPGILVWAVNGCLAWQREGLGYSVAVQDATQVYRKEMDRLAEFLADCCRDNPQRWTSAKDLYSTYCAWCVDEGETPLSQRAFGLSLTERGYQRVRGTGGTHGWKGVELISIRAVP